MNAAIGRRPLVLAGLATVATSTLVACGSEEDEAAGDESAGNGSAAETPETGPGGLVATDAVPVGGAASATTAEDEPIIVAQPSAGEFVAFTAVCTHKGCTVAPEGAELKCPCHGSVFNALTGENISGPAPSPLESVAVKVAGDQVVEG